MAELCKFPGHTFLVCRFQQTRTKDGMDLDRAVYDILAYRISIHSLRRQARGFFGFRVFLGGRQSLLLGVLGVLSEAGGYT